MPDQNIHHRAAPTVYVVILTFNKWELTRACIASLIRQDYSDYHIIVVDNGSMDRTVENVHQQFPEVTVIVNEANLGFAAGSNVGIQTALENKADFILMLNNDTVVPQNLLRVLVQHAQSLPDVGILTPRIFHYDNPESLWFAGSRRHWLLLEAVDFGPVGARRYVKPDELHTLDYIFGTVMLVPAEVFKKVGLFDESFFLYYEDMDFSLRVQSAGYKLYYIPDVGVQHHISSSTSSMPAMRYYHKARGSVIFFRKHANGVRLPFIIPYRLGSMLGTLIRLGRKRKWRVIQAYLLGLWHGLKVRLQLV